MHDLVAISVGNSRARLATFVAGDLHEPAAYPLAQADDLVAEALARAGGSAAIAIASVNPRASDPIFERLKRSTNVLRVGRDIPIPVTVSVDEPLVVGHDRLLNALAAFDRVKQACVVIDAGTCLTADFIDGEGVFHGGVISPGLSTMLRAMHEHAAALPLIEPAAPPRDVPFGRNTRDAMLLGAEAAIQGLAHLMIDRYAAFYEAYPQVIATGGDAASLFEGDDLIEHIVPTLTLLGVHAAFRKFLDEPEE